VTPAPSATLPNSAQLKSALLNAADLGPGFTASTDTSSSDNSTVTGCSTVGSKLNAPSASHQVQQTAHFTAGGLGPFVGESLTTEDQAALAEDYARDRAAFAACRSLTFKSGATTLTFDLSPIRFGGPGSIAARMDATFQGVQLNGYLAIEWLGTVVLGYYFFHVQSGSSQLAFLYYTQAVSKVQRVLDGAASSTTSTSGTPS
jgi:hypothetical protein